MHRANRYKEALDEKFGEGNWLLNRRLNNIFVALKKESNDGYEPYYDLDGARILIVDVFD